MSTMLPTDKIQEVFDEAVADTDWTKVMQFRDNWYYMQKAQHDNAIAHGFTDDREDGTVLCLMHSELSEALEALREGNPPSNKIPLFSSCEEELADTVIRIMSFAQAKGFNLAEAIVEKWVYNQSRPFKHGGKAF